MNNNIFKQPTFTNKYNIKRMIRIEVKKNLTKYFIANKYKTLKSNKIIKMAYRNNFFSKNASISYFRRSCLKLGGSRSVFKFFKMSRYACRYFALNGFLTGLRKASF